MGAFFVGFLVFGFFFFSPISKLAWSWTMHMATSRGEGLLLHDDFIDL